MNNSAEHAAYRKAMHEHHDTMLDLMRYVAVFGNAGASEAHFRRASESAQNVKNASAALDEAEKQ